jgi:hypothetical protein
MKTFKIEIREYLAEIIEIEAENIDDAILKAKEMYKKEEIILTDSNYIDTEIDEYFE